MKDVVVIDVDDAVHQLKGIDDREGGRKRGPVVLVVGVAIRAVRDAPLEGAVFPRPRSGRRDKDRHHENQPKTERI
jgi:hypothetical protein